MGINFKLLKKNSGFTLIELLIVIAILGVLMAVLLAVLNPAEMIARANDAKVISDVNMIYEAAQQYSLDPVTSNPYPSAFTPAGFTTAGILNPPAISTLPGGKPIKPSGYTDYQYLLNNATAANATDVVVCGNV